MGWSLSSSVVMKTLFILLVHLLLNYSNFSCKNIWCFTGLASRHLPSCETVTNADMHIGHNNRLLYHTGISTSQNESSTCSTTDQNFVNNREPLLRNAFAHHRQRAPHSANTIHAPFHVTDMSELRYHYRWAIT